MPAWCTISNRQHNIVICYLEAAFFQNEVNKWQNCWNWNYISYLVFCHPAEDLRGTLSSKRFLPWGTFLPKQSSSSTQGSSLILAPLTGTLLSQSVGWWGAWVCCMWRQAQSTGFSGLISHCARPGHSLPGRDAPCPEGFLYKLVTCNPHLTPQHLSIFYDEV